MSYKIRILGQYDDFVIGTSSECSQILAGGIYYRITVDNVKIGKTMICFAIIEKNIILGGLP